MFKETSAIEYIEIQLKKGMYPDTHTWNPFVGCEFDCVYCGPSFKRQLKRVGGNPQVTQGSRHPNTLGGKGGCTLCSIYAPHYHVERLSNNSIPRSSIVFVFGTGDIHFCDPDFVRKTLAILIKRSNPRQQYYFQSKNPECLKQYIGEYPENSILLTTIETNRDAGYDRISRAPKPSKRFKDFLELDYPRKVLTVEPIMDFDLAEFSNWIVEFNEQGSLLYVWLGFNSKSAQVSIPEPSEDKVIQLIDQLSQQGVQVKGKELRGISI
ncbi:hypothetical protein ES703_51061 [subsurface metagenome]